jgi:hypothetical protein
MLHNIRLKNIIGHAKRFALGIEIFLLQVIAVLAAQVTDGAYGLDKNLKIAGRFGHDSIDLKKISLFLEKV